MRMTFGKYKDQDMEEIPSRYLLWAAENLADEELACEADRIWQEREKFNTHIKEDY